MGLSRRAFLPLRPAPLKRYGDAHLADVQAPPFGDGEFDVVLGNWMLYHLPDLDRGVAEIARVLRPGGRFVGYYNRDGHLGELWSLVNRDLGREEDYGEPSRDSSRGSSAVTPVARSCG